MKYLIYILLCCSTFVLSAQETPKSGLKIYYGFEHDSRFFTASDANKWIKTILKEVEKPAWGYAYGLIRKKQFKNPKLSMEYGVGVLRRTITTHQTDSIFLDGKFYPNAGLIHDYDYNYITIPLCVNYQLFEKSKFSISGSLGMSINLIRYASHQFIFVQEGQTYRKGANSFDYKSDFSIDIGLGFKYKILKRLDLEIRPTVKQSLKSGEFFDFYKSYFNSIGLDVGIIILGR